MDDAEACGRVFAAMASKFSAPEIGKEGRERAKSGKAPTDVVEMLKWAHGTYELPENEHLGYGQSGVPEFLDGPHEGELIEFHQDYLQWMTIAQKRVNGEWMHKFSPPLREWIQYWIVNKSAGGNPVNPRSFGAMDWQSVEPIRGIYAEDYDAKES